MGLLLAAWPSGSAAAEITIPTASSVIFLLSEVANGGDQPHQPRRLSVTALPVWQNNTTFAMLPGTSWQGVLRTERRPSVRFAIATLRLSLIFLWVPGQTAIGTAAPLPAVQAKESKAVVAVKLIFLEVTEATCQKLGVGPQLPNGGMVLGRHDLVSLARSAQTDKNTSIMQFPRLQTTPGMVEAVKCDLFQGHVLTEIAVDGKSVYLEIRRWLRNSPVRVTVEAELAEGSSLIFGGWKRDKKNAQDADRIVIIIAEPQIVRP